MKYFLVIMAFVACLSSTAQTAGSSKLSLPEGVSVADGKLVVKPGYIATFTKHKRGAEVREIATNKVTGTFSCDCTEGSGTCEFAIAGDTMVCTGTCSCSFRVVVKGIKYMVTLQSGTMQKL